jgi:hypothetical protein
MKIGLNYASALPGEHSSLFPSEETAVENRAEI